LHPEGQKSALQAVIEKVGIVGVPIVNQRTGRILDGHLRQDIFGDMEVYVLYVDLSEAEEDIVLATYDPIGSMAEMDAQKVVELQRDMAIEAGVLKNVLDGMKKQAEELLDIEEQLSTGTGGSKRGFSYDKAQTVKVVLLVEHLDIFEQAIKAVGILNRGDALIEICRQFLEAHHE